jgi:hypothetical protein
MAKWWWLWAVLMIVYLSSVTYAVVREPKWLNPNVFTIGALGGALALMFMLHWLSHA